ncbi:helix-turn-helix domain-containing protein [Kitasatospora aureofaciens]|uniref:helix-turn-helix domain-containing protein n=1 Tax=Kitasatospora aureofaciens TaxID=1894 RepID=UPI0036F45FCF
MQPLNTSTVQSRIARETGLHLDTVRRWRGRFAERGLGADRPPPPRLQTRFYKHASTDRAASVDGRSRPLSGQSTKVATPPGGPGAASAAGTQLLALRDSGHAGRVQNRRCVPSGA